MVYSGADGLEWRKVRGSVASLKLPEINKQQQKTHHKTQKLMRDDDAWSAVILHRQFPAFLH